MSEEQDLSVNVDANADAYVIIMAGGRGERFWPVSRQKTPKQLIRLLGERSFLQDAVDRVLPLVPAERVLVITNRSQVAQVRKQLKELPPENVIDEPVGRDTCAAVALGAAVVGARSHSAVMAVLPADHVIPDPQTFRRVLSDSFAMARKNPVIVTIGIEPSEPATGYGYIKVGAALSADKVTGLETSFSRVDQFVEKPDVATAEKYLQSGIYRWNAGMFVWSYETIASALRQHVPALYDACLRWEIAASRGASRLRGVLTKEYPGIQKISIDYALLEKAANVVVAGGDFDWDDLGAWPALARHIKLDDAGNAIVGRVVAVDSNNNIVVDYRTRRQTVIGLVAVENCIVVLTDDAVLIASRADAQKIKDLVKRLAEMGYGELV